VDLSPPTRRARAGRPARGRALRWALAAALGLAVSLGAPGPLRAGDGASEDLAMLRGTPAEQEALASLDKGKRIRAREQAEAILKDHPESFVATWVLARVFHDEEGNLARSLFLLRKARRLFTARFGPAPQAPEARRWHKKLLLEESWLLGEMDDPAGRLRVLDELDAVYKPPRLDLRMWPLMKLRRFDEARALGRKLTRSDDIYERISGYNGLVATEAEARLRQRTYELSTEAIEATQGRSCILLHNGSSAALGALRFDEAESLARRALKADIDDCSNPPYSRLVTVYLAEGAFQKAVSALKGLREAPIEKRYREQFEMGNRALLTELLYLLNQLGPAETFARDTFRMPDRTGMSSSSREEIQLGQAVTYATVLMARMEQERERAAVRGFWEALPHWEALETLRWRLWEVRRRALRLASDGDMLAEAMRPFLHAIMPWEAGYAAPLLGEGLVSQAVAQARREDAGFPEVTPYFDAVDGEVAWRRGALDAARELGERALKGLPRQAVVTRHRLMVWLGDAAYRQGDAERARTLWAAALDRFPSAFRHLGVALAVTVEGRRNPWAQEVVERLRTSPRLRVGSGLDQAVGFVVDVQALSGDGRGEGHEDRLSVCLSDASGKQVGCAEAKLGGEAGLPAAASREAVEEAVEAMIVEVCDAFHDKVFAPKVSLTQSDINSLDGSPIRVDADLVVKDLLGADEDQAHKGGEP